ncbi:MAG TPA: glycoside hydrolase family 76 protein, partial [Clostridiales bacterium]|nr:glycoside hydrolase family 76 protein [Clostridiales bacterium]
MGAAPAIFKFFLPFILSLVQLFNLVSTGDILRLPETDAGFSADLPVYERNVYRGKRLADGYYRNFWFEDLSLLTSHPRKDVEYNWGYGGLLSLSYKLALLDESHLPRCEKVVEGLRYYRQEKDGVFDGYSHTRAMVKDKADRGVSYDDDMWIARDLIALHELTGEKHYLDLATEIADYLIKEAYVDIESEIFIRAGYPAFEGLKYGGFYWNDGHEALHTCSNGSAAQLLAALYRLTGNRTYLDHAEKSYNFLKLLVRPEGVFCDLMRFEKDENNRIIGVKEVAGPSYTY